MSKSFFSLSSILDEIRSTARGKKALEKYEAVVGPINEDEWDKNAFFNDNMAVFNTSHIKEVGNIRFPECLEDEPDEIKDPFLQLIFASFSSTCELTLSGEEITVNIHVEQTDKEGKVNKVDTTIDELSIIQVIFLMRIYLTEQIELTTAGREEDGAECIKELVQNNLRKLTTNLRALIKKSGKSIRSGGFQDVAGMDALKDSLYKRIIWVLRDKGKAEKYRITPPNGMLLYGPHGCGKTFFAQKFAEESGFNYMLVNGSDLGSTYIHGTQGKIAELFKKATENAPTVICFDEFDSFVPSRGTETAQHRDEEVNEFLTQLNNCSQKGIFVIGTTNRIEAIDPAILRKGRLDLKLEIPAPDEETRKRLFDMYLQGRPREDNINLARLSELTEGYASSDIAYIVNEAALTAALNDEAITHDILEDSIKANPSSLTPSMMRKKIGFMSG